MTQYALSALKDKRSTLAGEIADFEKRIAKRRQQIAHIDAAIRIFAPDFDVDALPVKQVRTKPSRFGRGEITRVIYDIRRTAEKPLKTAEITDRAMPILGEIEPKRSAVNRKVWQKLNYHMVSKGAVYRDGAGRHCVWSLKRDQTPL